MWDIEVSSSDIDVNDINAVQKVLKSNWLSMGPKVKEFENLWSKALGVDYVTAVSSGTAALHLACVCCDFSHGDEVIVPALTFVATANAVKYTGATPVIVDIESKDNLIISKEQIENNITSKTKGIIIVHYAGYTYNIEEIKEIADKYNLYLIEDSAHAMLSRYKNKTLGSFGHISCFSFYPNKNMTTGEGGLVVTKYKKFYKKLKNLRTHGMTSSTWKRYNSTNSNYDVNQLGYNYRMDDLRAALGISQFNRLEKNLQHRAKLVKYYRKLLEDNSKITIPFLKNKTISSNYIFVIIAENPNIRDNIIQSLTNNNIQTSFHYTPLHLFSYYKENKILPVVENVAEGLITLPLHNDLSTEDVKFICNIINHETS